MAIVSINDSDREIEKSFYKELGGLLRQIRTVENDYSREKVAKETGFSVDQIRRFETGEALTAYAVKKLANYYGESYEELFLDEDIPAGRIRETDSTGLSKASIKWLEKTNRENKDIIKIINRLLSDEAIADTIFGAFYAFARLRIPHHSDKKGLHIPAALGLTDEESLLRFALSEYIFTALDEVRRTEKLTKYQQTSPEMVKIFNQLMDSKVKIHERQEERYEGDSEP